MTAPARAPTGIEFEPDIGVIRLTRAHVDHLARIPGDPGPTDSAAAARDRAELRLAGALGPAGPHPALGGPVAVIRNTRSRFVIRRWRSRGRRTIEGPNRARRHRRAGGRLEPLRPSGSPTPQPTALARLLAGLLGLGPTAGDLRLPVGNLTWDQVRALSTDPPAWAADALQPGDQIGVFDLAWQARPGGPQGSVLVLVDLGRAGLATVEPIDELNGGPRFRLVARRPEEIWFGLCRPAPSPR